MVSTDGFSRLMLFLSDLMLYPRFIRIVFNQPVSKPSLWNKRPKHFQFSIVFYSAHGKILKALFETSDTDTLPLCCKMKTFQKKMDIQITCFF